MEMNWKDFWILFIFNTILPLIYWTVDKWGKEELFYLIGVEDLIADTLPTILLLALLYSVSMIIYFWRNKCDFRSARKMSAAFGFSFILLASIYVSLIYHGSQESGCLGGPEHCPPKPLLEVNDFKKIIPFFSGLLITTLGLLICFSINRLLNRLKNDFRRIITIRVNWKDFGLMYLTVLFFTLLLVTVSILVGPENFRLFLLLNGKIFFYASIFLFGILMLFYFLRNRCDVEEAAVISFSFVMTAFYMMFSISAFILERAGMFRPLGGSLSIIEAFFSEIPSTSFSIGFLFMFLGILIWFAVNKISKKKRYKR